MPSKTLTYIRGKYPQLDKYDDDKLVLAMGQAYPQLLENDPELSSEYDSYKNPQGMLENMGKSAIASTIFDNSTAMFGVLEVVSKPFNAEVSKWMQQMADRSAEEATELRETGDIAFGIGFDRGVNQEAFSSKIGSGIGSLAPMVATGGVGALVGLTAKAASVAGMAMGGLQSFGSTYKEAREGYLQQGLSEEESANAAIAPAAKKATTDIIAMAVGGAVASKLKLTDIETIAPKLLSKPVKESIESVARVSNVKSKIAQTAGSGVLEGAEEGVSDFIGAYVIARHSYDPTVTLDESVSEAWDSFRVGMTIGSGVDVVQSALSRKSPEELAKRNTVRSTMPQTAAKLDEIDARNEVLPDQARVSTGASSPELTQEVERAQEDRQRVVTERGKIVEQARESGGLPLWWGRYEGSDTGPENNTGEVPSGLRYAGQQTVDEFIEAQEAFNELSGMRVEEAEGGGFVVFNGDKELDIFETKNEANAYARNMAVASAPEAVQKRIEDYKRLTRALRDLDEKELAYDAALRASKEQAQVREDSATPQVSSADLNFVADALGIQLEDLRFAGVDVTPEMVEQLRFAPEEGVRSFWDQVRNNRAIQAEQLAETKSSKQLELQRLERERAKAAAIARAEMQRVASDTRSLQDQQRAATTPQTSEQLSEFVEDVLEYGGLSPMQKTVVNRLQQRKTEAIVSSIGETNPEALESAVSTIESIDENIARVLGDYIRPLPNKMNASDLQRLQQLVATDRQEAGSSPSTSAELEQSLEPDQRGIEVDGNTVGVSQELSGDTSTEMMKALTRFNRRYGSLFGLSRIVAKPMKGGAGVASAARMGDTRTIYVDEQRLQKSLKSKRWDLYKAIEEEMLHNLDGQALTIEYAKQIGSGQINPKTTLRDFIRGYYTDLASSLSSSEIRAARKIYGEDFIDNVHMAQEFVRQLIQKRHTNEVTEDARRNPIVKRLLNALSDMLGSLKLSGAAKRHLEKVEALLAESKPSEPTVEVEIRADSTPQQEGATAVSEDTARQLDNEVVLVEQPEKVTEPVTDVDSKINEKMGKSLIYIPGHIRKALESNAASLSNTATDEAEFKLKMAYWKFLEDSKGEDINSEGRGFKWALASQRAVIDVIRAETAQIRGGSTMDVSIDAPVSDDGDATFGDTLKHTSSSPVPGRQSINFDAYIEKNRDELAEAGMSDRDLLIVRGIYEGKTLQDIANELGVSAKSGISAAHSRIIKKMQSAARRNPDLIDDLRDAIREDSDASNHPLAYASRPDVSLVSRIGNKLADLKGGKFRLLRQAGLTSPLKIETPEEGVDTYVDMHQSKIDSDGYINRTMNVVNQTDRALRKAIHKEYKDINEADVALINDALGGDRDALKHLPAEVGDIVIRMRDHIDSLTQYMLDNGWVSGELMAKMESNVGTYLARSYRIFDDAKFVKNLDPAVKAKAVSFIERKLINSGVAPSVAQQQALTSVEDLLAEYQKETGRQMYERGKLGAKDLSLFMKRNNDIAPEIRQLMGEYNDPIVNYAKTVNRMAHFVGRQQFLNDIRYRGEGIIFFEKNDPKRNTVGANYRIGGRTPSDPESGGLESQTEYGPIAGLYTTKEVHEVLEHFDKIYGIMGNGPLATIAKLNVLSKSMKTLGSLMTHARNALGQAPFLVLNGHLNPVRWRVGKKAVSAAWAGALGSDEALQRYYNKMTSLGLTGEEATTAELRRVLTEHNQFINNSDSIMEMMDKGLGKGLKRFVKNKLVFGVQKFYRMTDEVGKMMAFEMEKEALSKLPTYAKLSETELEKLAAKRVRATIPTYTELPPAVQKARMQPIVGPFMSFAYESIRTQVNNVKIINEEFRNGNTAYAASRMAGHLAVGVGLNYVIKILSEVYGGVSEEEQEDFRKLLPFYEQNAAIYFSRDEKGKINYTNWSFNNPYNSTADSLAALMGLYGKQSEGGMVSEVVNSLSGVIDPFASETPIASAFIDVSRNRNQYGSSVYNPEQSGEKIALDVTTHMLKAILAPGTVERAWNRWGAAFKGRALRSGEIPTVAQEIQNEMFGFKPKSVDYNERLAFAGYLNKNRISDANKLFNDVAGTKAGGITKRDIVESYVDANRSRYRIFRDVYRQVNAARKGGLSDAAIMTALVSGSMSRKEVSAILNGRMPPLDISPSISARARKAGRTIPFSEIGTIKRKFAAMRIN